MVHKFARRCILACVASTAIVAATQSANAAPIYTESFEAGLQANTAIINGGNNGTKDFWSVLPSGSLNIGYTVLNVDGASYFGFRDINGSWGGGNPRALEIQNLDISLYENIKLTVALSSRKDSNTNFEANDIFNIKADTGAGFTTLDSFMGSGTSGPLNTGIKNGNGDELNNTLTDYMYNITDGALLTLRFDALRFQNPNEAVAIDNIRITGDLKAIPEPGALALFGLGLAGLTFARRKRII